MEASNPCSVISSEESFLLSIYFSLWRNRCVSVIVGLKIPDIICSSEEPSLSIDEIAAKAGCDSTKQLYPLMRLAARWGIGIELENKHFTKNKTLELLRRDQGPSLGHLIDYMIGDEMFAGLKSLPACVKNGTPAFVIEHGMTHIQYLSDIANSPYNPDKMYEGASKYKIGSDERRRELSEAYEMLLKYLTRLWTPDGVSGVKTLFKAYPWSDCKKIVEVGGSTGDFLISILNLPGCENIQGYILELPAVVDEAMKKKEEFVEVVHRLEFIKQDFFQVFPSRLHLEADTVIVKNILAMFAGDEEKIRKIFSNCRDLFSENGGKMLVIEHYTPDAGESQIGVNGLEMGLFSIHWLNIGGVHILTRNEWLELFNNTSYKLGYSVPKIYNTFDGGAVIFELHYKP